MYLKSIEVQGFKSFAKKLVFEFHNGITGIVGPNGSGKSNVADAVRWVLGEQSAKQLRGSSMQDVIFSGTEMRKPQSYAYVALTISNEDHKLNLPYEEVQVARRVYRSGESEYLLNGVTCRLRDVQELFFDTGIGKEGYSIIGQGQIDKILSGKPEERRELFDEAAGIVKFKKRKAAAEKNLETERQNLLRVQDILTELEKQVGPLEEQSKKAKEFLQLKEELKQFEVGLFCMDYETLQQETEEIEKNLSHTKEELEQAKADKEKSRSEYDSVESAIADFDRSVEKKKEKVNQDKLLITNFEGEIRITKEKISSAAQGKEYYKERTDALEESKQAANEELASYTASQKEALLELEKITDEEKSLSSQMEQLEKAILEDEIELNEQNEQIMDSMNASSKITVEQQKAKSMLEQILSDVQKADNEWNVVLLRYFNPIGAHKSGTIGENPNGIPNNLMPYIAKVAVGKLEKVHVFGNDYPTPDGTGVRDYIHVCDLASGHVAALNWMNGKTGVEIFNLGTGTGTSVLEVVAAFSKACGKELPYVIRERRAGDIAANWCDASKAERMMGWKAQYDIADMCRDSWNWQSHNPNGFADAE